MKVREQTILGKSDYYFVSPVQPTMTEPAQKALDWALNEKKKSGICVVSITIHLFWYRLLCLSPMPFSQKSLECSMSNAVPLSELMYLLHEMKSISEFARSSKNTLFLSCLVPVLLERG